MKARPPVGAFLVFAALAGILGALYVLRREVAAVAEVAAPPREPDKTPAVTPDPETPAVVASTPLEPIGAGETHSQEGAPNGDGHTAEP